MHLTSSGGSGFSVALENEQATERMMHDIASVLEPGDLITLSGDLGAGKTTFARALIRHIAGDETLDVPSPTFTLMQLYELDRFTIAHADLYRVTGTAELAELGFDDLQEGAVVLIEWPDRAAGFLPADRLDIAFTLAPQLGPEYRNARVTGYGTFAARAERIALIRRFLDQSGYGAAVRVRLAGDASTRAYERLTLEGRDVIMMNAPRRPDGPPVRDGKPYSAIAHLAEDVKPFVAMANGLRERGFSAPEIYHADLEHGLILLEDLGDDRIVEGIPPVPLEDHYDAAVDVLVALHGMELPDTLSIDDMREYRLPRYDIDAFMIETELLLDWYLPHIGATLSDAARTTFRALWREALQPVIDAPSTWVMRDYHSPNILWLPERHGVASIGLLDFQDAMIGSPAYDLASLLQDARVDIPEPLEVTMLGYYVRARRDTDPDFDSSRFIQHYATLAAQRATKILGIFARLNHRDGKPQYLRHMPRLWNYLRRSLAHPALAPLNGWYSVHMPASKHS